MDSEFARWSASYGLCVCLLISIPWILALLVGQHLMNPGFACWSASHGLGVACWPVSLGVRVCLLKQEMICYGRLAMHLDGCVLNSNIETGLSGLWHAACYAMDVTWQCNLVSCRQHCLQHAKQCRLQVNMPCN